MQKCHEVRTLAWRQREAVHEAAAIRVWAPSPASGPLVVTRPPRAQCSTTASSVLMLPSCMYGRVTPTLQSDGALHAPSSASRPLTAAAPRLSGDSDHAHRLHTGRCCGTPQRVRAGPHWGARALVEQIRGGIDIEQGDGEGRPGSRDAAPEHQENSVVAQLALRDEQTTAPVSGNGRSRPSHARRSRTHPLPRHRSGCRSAAVHGVVRDAYCARTTFTCSAVTALAEFPHELRSCVTTAAMSASVIDSPHAAITPL